MDASLLIEKWAERDSRYAKRWHAEHPAPLSADECSTIVRFRIAEALLVPAGKGRNAALRYIADWRPPGVSPWNPLLIYELENRRRRKRDG
jgi:hypothetical protein